MTNPTSEELSNSGRLLEKHLQDFVLANIGSSLGISLKLAAKERVVEGVGRIDILAKGPLGTTWAIELKIGTASRDAVGQLSSYMGALKDEGIDAKGILIASDFDASALAASKIVPEIYCFSYSIGFSFEPVGIRQINIAEFEIGLMPIDSNKLPKSRKTIKRKSEKTKTIAGSNEKAIVAWPLPRQRD